MKKILTTFISMAFICSSCQKMDVMEPNVPPKNQKAQVIIIGTLHEWHYKNPKYSPQILKEIILSVKPDVILNELPPAYCDSNGRPLFRDPNKHPEGWAADTVATTLGIKQIPVDHPDRQEILKKANYFEREEKFAKLLQKWMKQIAENDPNSLDLKIVRLYMFADQSQAYFTDNGPPEIINSEGFDSIIKIKHEFVSEGNILSTIMEKYPGYEAAVNFEQFLETWWQERNKVMTDNIIKVAKEYPAKRLIVVTGAEHRYILRDLLGNNDMLEVKEYWEVNKASLPKEH